MKDSPEKISPLRRRMIEDMRMRKLSTKTPARRFVPYGTSLDIRVARRTRRVPRIFGVTSFTALIAASPRLRSTRRSRDCGSSSK